ncbi:hypothetical protein ACH4ZU_09800 [Streptomyces sp. NPDC020472]|uniref:sodium:solute symporter family transporter n=1 Tax=Streptomyces sp. NPDC020472 TaxID=3365075 RepID=UPI0037953212
MADLHGTSFVQVVKVVVTLAVLALVGVLALRRFSWDPGGLLSAAAARSMSPQGYLKHGLWAHTADLGPLNTLSDHVVVILGTAMTPHLILRVGASRSGTSARRSTSIAVACVAFLAVLTTVTSVTFAAAVSFARDVFARLPRGARHDEGRELRVLRTAVIVLCVVSMTLSAAVHGYPVEFLVTFSMSVAATCVFPVLIYSFHWPGFNRRGLLWAVYGGLALCVLLTLFSPIVSGTEYALRPGASFDWYPLHTPGLISVPAAFLLGGLASRYRPTDVRTRG